MWRYRARVFRPYISIAIAFWLSSIGPFLKGGCIPLTIGFCLIGFGFVVLLILCLIPNKIEIPPIDYSIEHSKIIWGLWYTGDRHYKYIIGKKYNNIKRILIMRPNSNAFFISTDYPQESEIEIKRLTFQAIKRGIEIRWYTEPQESSLTIYEPMQIGNSFSKNAYFILSKMDTGIPRKDRTLYILKKEDDEHDFQIQVDRFNKLWESSSVPNPEEYK